MLLVRGWKYLLNSYENILKSLAFWKLNIRLPDRLFFSRCNLSGSVDGFLYLSRCQTGRLRWKMRTSGPITGTPVAGNEMIYIGSNRSIRFTPFGHKKFSGESVLVKHIIITLLGNNQMSRVELHVLKK
jgi:hypothetical protein